MTPKSTEVLPSDSLSTHIRNGIGILLRSLVRPDIWGLVEIIHEGNRDKGVISQRPEVSATEPVLSPEAQPHD